MGFALLTTLTFGFFAWLPSLFMRKFGWSAGEIGTVLGGMALLFGATGTYLGGYMADKVYRRRGKRDAALLVAISATL